MSRKISRKMKLSSSKCITRLNLKRRSNNQMRISNTSTNILKLLKIYKFYKITQFRLNLKKQMRRQAHGRQIDEKVKPMSENIITKGGYKFVILNGLHYKLTKKSYSEEEIEKWCAGRKSASSKMKTYHKEKKIRRKQKEKDQVIETEAIYNREISLYPEELQELLAQ